MSISKFGDKKWRAIIGKFSSILPVSAKVWNEPADIFTNLYPSCGSRRKEKCTLLTKELKKMSIVYTSYLNTRPNRPEKNSSPWRLNLKKRYRLPYLLTYHNHIIFGCVYSHTLVFFGECNFHYIKFMCIAKCHAVCIRIGTLRNMLIQIHPSGWWDPIP